MFSFCWGHLFVQYVCCLMWFKKKIGDVGMDMNYDNSFDRYALYFPNLNSLVNFQKSSPDQSHHQGRARSLWSLEVRCTQLKENDDGLWWNHLECLTLASGFFLHLNVASKKAAQVYSQTRVSSSCTGWWIGKSYSHLCYTYTPQSHTSNGFTQGLRAAGQCLHPSKPVGEPPLWDWLQPSNSAKALG